MSDSPKRIGIAADHGGPTTTSKPVPSRLYLIRHGETGWSLSGQYTGRADIPLAAHGKDAAREFGQRLRGIPFAYVLTSPLQRAQQICALAGLGPTPEIEPDLAEWDHGDDEGSTLSDIIETRPDWNLFRNGSPRGETPAQIYNRADRLIARLRALAGNVALFSHGDFGRVLAARWIGLRAEQAQHLLLSTASVSVLCYDHDLINEPAIALRHFAAYGTFDQKPDPGAGDTISMKQLTIERWENEGGYIPQPAQSESELS
jgi:broad specificity phosphatase PhoE